MSTSTSAGSATPRARRPLGARVSRLAAGAALATAMTLGGSASADPLVRPGGKPGVAQAWARVPGGLALTLADGYGADQVRAAIEATIPGAKITVADGKLVVGGVDEKKLLAQLEKVDVSTDEVDAMVQSLQGVGGDDASGSSIRATSTANFASVVDASTPPLAAQVVRVKHGKYPFVAVTVRLDARPRDPALAKLPTEITVVPRVELKAGVIAPSDARSRVNIGAWYVKPGDKVSVSLEGQTEQGFWVARAFERAPR
jgi:hypothetical protein